MAKASRRNIVLLGAGVLAPALLVAWLLTFKDGAREPITRRTDRGYVETAAAPRDTTTAPTTSTTGSAPATDIPSSPYSQSVEARGGTVTGIVVDALGDPVSGAEVSFFRGPDYLAACATTRTDEHGGFSLDRLPIGDYGRVRARAAGRIGDDEHLNLRAESPTETVRIQLWDATTVRGRVVDAASGAPIAGAQVCASYEASRCFGFEPQAEGRSGADGSFELEGVPFGVIALRAVADGYEMATESVQPSARQETELRLPAGTGTKISVTVTGLDAEGLRAARVWMIAYDKGSARRLPSSLLKGALDAEGRWQAAGLPSFEYLVHVIVEGWSLEPREMRLKDLRGPGEAAFRALRDGQVVLKGTLRDGAGAPLPGEQLLVRASNGGKRSTARTGADGSFSVASPLAPKERCVLYLVDSEYVLDQPKDPEDFNASDMRVRTWHEAVVDEGTPLELKAIRASRVRGRILREDGQPLPLAKVSLEEANPQRGPRWMAFAWTTADAAGCFLFDGRHCVENEMRVSVTDAAGSGISEPFRLVAGGDVEGIELRIRSAATVEGMVRGEDGRPVAGARIHLYPADEQSKSHHEGNIHEVMSDRSGRYRFTGVGPGSFTLAAMFSEARSRGTGENFEVAAGARVERDLSVK